MRTLAGFARVALKPGERKTVCVTLPPSALEFYDVARHAFVVEAGRYEVSVGRHSRCLLLHAAFTARGETVALPPAHSAGGPYGSFAANTFPDAAFAAIHTRPLPRNQKPVRGEYTQTTVLGDMLDSRTGRALHALALCAARLGMHFSNNPAVNRRVCEMTVRDLVVRSAPHAGARKYLSLPFFCDLVSYGGNVVASVAPEAEAAVRAYVERYAPEHCFETPNMNVLADALRPFGMRICFMAEYFLPDVSRMRQWDCGYALKVLGPADFAGLYRPEWSNALCEKRRELDVLAVGAYDGARLVGLAGCSADCESMWQIGVDVLPGYRRRGVAAALTSRLAAETLARGKVPFYCAAWSNIKSVRNAVKCGFVPAWAELTAKPEAFVRELNGQ